MIKCMPIITAFNETKISFSVTIVDADINIDNIHTMYGGGQGYPGKKIGEASLILGDCSETWERTDTEVLYLAGYRYDGKEFCVETEKSIIEACKVAAKAIWG